MSEIMSLLLFAAAVVILLIGYPVAISLAGTGLLFAGIGYVFDLFDPAFLEAVPNRIFGVMGNETLIAVPLFVFMGVMLEKAKIAEELLDTMALLFGPMRGGLGISVCIVGMLLAASTGIVGATVVTMGLLSLPTMVRRGYDPKVATGVICASGTLGQIIPPSIVLVLLGDVISSAYQQAQLDMGIYSPKSVTVGDLFLGALIPGLLLVVGYIGYLIFKSVVDPDSVPAIPAEERGKVNDLGTRIFKVLIPPLLLVVLVLGSILGGLATPTEAASVGAIGAVVLSAFRRNLSWPILKDVMRSTTQVSSMVFMILVGAAVFSLVFRGYGGDDLVRDFLHNLPGGEVGAMIIVMLVMFFLGFFLDFMEITFVVVPIVAPVLLMMGIDPIWLGIMFAINLQTSFLTPPFGFALFYLRGVAPDSISTGTIYKGVIPFIFIQLLMLGLLSAWPSLATWLPHLVYGNN
ncbi:C4-dicarboxylate ABC transporter [Pokkaliibacter plantistimulans]|uniref:TRAP transporter large permease protein n=1 Tax=Pokkaliibacter plantistimulans TaxID=1635171 RepID=A0ABX5LZZ2_9GAMM|nr:MULTISPECIES: TRAP transporter large permease subunit [Pokkaliibacter]MDH2432913.1 TRAP transporter large permease subunit [Pokkaliibacter sp. MBI-7]PXF32199.1 C4-dicarboxylate ABC transporter [Pokkaliibacter plantistimulans]